MKLICSLIALSAISVATNAAPVIESIDVAGPDQKTVISGSQFGSFDGEVLSWDDFEHHDVGLEVGNTAPVDGFEWTNIYGYKGQGIVIDDSKSVSGKKAIKLDWSKDSHTIRAFGWSGKGPYNELYISYWRHMEGSYNESENDNHKQFYLYGNSDQMPQLMPLMPAGTSRWGVYNNVGDGDVSWSEKNNINTEGWSWSNTKEKFQRWEIYTELNEPYTESNAVIEVRVDGKLGIQNDSYRTRYVDGEFTDFRLGHMAQGFTDTAKAWFDDVYIATTRARIEVCDSANYEECSIKNIQYVNPSEWSDEKVSVDLRNARRYRDQPVFLYLIDGDGNVSNSVAVPKPVMN